VHFEPSFLKGWDGSIAVKENFCLGK